MPKQSYYGTQQRKVQGKGTSPKKQTGGKHKKTTIKSRILRDLKRLGKRVEEL